MTFTPATRQIAYTALSSSLAINKLKIIGDDGYNAAVSTIVTLNVDKKPVLNSAITNLTGIFVAFQSSNFTISGALFSDESTSTLTFTATYANGSALDSWFTFTPPASPPSGVFKFEGTYPNYSNANLVITVTATDGSGLLNSVNVTITIDATCHSTCQLCNGPDIDDCTSCFSGRFLDISA